MFTGGNSFASQLDLDFSVGYSPNVEDLDIINTDYVSPNEMTELNYNDLNIVHLNICGAINKQDSLSRLLTMMGGRNKVNVVSLNETWLRKETENKFSIPGFNYIGNVQTGRKGGGVGLLISEELLFRELLDLLPKLDILECICIEIKSKTKSVIVISMYRAPNTSLVETLEELKKVFQVLKKENRPVAMCTDRNLDLLKSELHLKTQEFLEILTDSGFISTITKPSRITHSSATLIDNIFINKYLAQDYLSLLLYDDISDHLPCVVSIKNYEHDRMQPVSMTCRKFDKKSIENITQDLHAVDWNVKLTPLNCENSFDQFHDILQRRIDIHAPEHSYIKKGKKSVQPWISYSIKNVLSSKKDCTKKIS